MCRVIVVLPAVPADAGEVLTVTLAAFVTESRALGQADIPPLRDTLDDVGQAVRSGAVLVARDLSGALPGRLVGTVRLEDHDGSGYLGRLAVAPDRRGAGIGGLLLDAMAVAAHGRFDRIDLVTAARSAHNVAMYARRGWVELPAGTGTGRHPVDDVGIELVWMRRLLPAVEVRTRDLEPAADGPAVAGIWAAATTARYREQDPAHACSPAALAAAILHDPPSGRPGAFGIVLDLAGRPVAVAVAAPARTRDGTGPDLLPGLVHLSAVCADPCRWGRGLGATAVKAVLAAAAARGFDRAQLTVDVDNARARALYARLGFSREPGWQGSGRSGAVLERWSRPTGAA